MIVIKVLCINNWGENIFYTNVEKQKNILVSFLTCQKKYRALLENITVKCYNE